MSVASGSYPSSFDYTVNSLGQRTAVGPVLDGNSAPVSTNTVSWGWGYDNLGQLTSADSPTADNDNSYTYDTIGNRLTSATGTFTTVAGVTTLTPDTLTEYYGGTGTTPAPGANALNQYETITTGTSTVEPDYDVDGNATGYPLPADVAANATLVWDAENRLVEITRADEAVIDYAYDYMGRRISKTVDPPVGDIVTTSYLYDGWNLIAEYTGTNLEKTYTWGMDLSGSMQGAGGVGGLLAVNTGSPASYYPTYDGNGNVSEYLEYTPDDPGTTGENEEAFNVVAHYEYDAFGNLTAQTYADDFGVESFSHKFSTKPMDDETGLYYYGYRYYDPVTGRWPSRDPIEEEGGVNLYGFVGNNGVGRVDVLGRSWGDRRDYVVNPVAGRAYYKNEDGVIMKRHVVRIDPFWGDAYYDYSDTWERPAITGWDPYVLDDSRTPVPTQMSIDLGNALGNQFEGMTQERCVCVAGGTWAAMGIFIVATPAVITSAEGFLVNGKTITWPWAIQAMRYGEIAIEGTQHWALRAPQFMLNNPVVMRAVLAIMPQWNNMAKLTTGVIPRGTKITIGIVGPQAYPGQFAPGGWIQIIVKSSEVVEKCLK